MYVMVEGQLQHAERMSEEILKEHMAYSQVAIQQGLIQMSSLKSDESGGFLLMKADHLDLIEEYLAKEPLYLHGIQTYRVIPLDVHYLAKES